MATSTTETVNSKPAMTAQSYQADVFSPPQH